MLPSNDFTLVSEREYHDSKESPYWLPKDDIEGNRLDLQHHLLKSVFGENVLKSVTETLDFQKSKLKILDVACGTGIWIKEMQKEFPGCSYEGCDIIIPKGGEVKATTDQETTACKEKDFCSTSSRDDAVINGTATYTLAYGDVVQGLDYPDDTFNFVHMRLLIAGIRKEDWPKVIKELLRITKPGGVIQFLEPYLGIGDDERNPWQRASKAIIEIFVEKGIDPKIALKLPAIIESFSNAAVIEIHQRYMDMGSNAPWAKGMVIQYRELFHSMMPILAKKLGISTDEEKKAFLTSLCESDAYKKSNIYYVAISVKKTTVK